MAKRVSMAEVSGARVRGRSRLGRIDSVTGDVGGGCAIMRGGYDGVESTGAYTRDLM